MFDRICLWSHLDLDFCLLKDFSWKDFLITVSISLLIIGQFIFSISSWFSPGRLYKNCMIISIDAEKASIDKILHPLMIKNSPETVHRGNPPEHSTGYTQWMSGNIILSDEKLEALPLSSGTRRMCTLITIIQHSFGSQAMKSEKKKKYKDSKMNKK